MVIIEGGKHRINECIKWLVKVKETDCHQRKLKMEY